MTRAVISSGFVLSLVVTALGQPKGQPPKLPNEKVAEAWEAAGAEHGSAEWSEAQIRRLTSRTRPAKKAGEIPAFLIQPETKLAGLKDPGVPFGLVLRKEVGDEQLKALPTLKNLQYVLAYGQPLTDAGAKDLARQKGLRYLDLGRSKVTGAGMKVLATLPALETLHVDSIKVSNAGLAELVKIKTLRDLNLNDADVTYDALAGLAALQDLETLGMLGVSKSSGKPAGLGEWVTKLPRLRDVTASRLEDADLKLLGGVPTLRTLAFDAEDVTDSGMKDLARLKDLEVLFLRDAKLTGAGLKELTSLAKLHRLVLIRGGVTDADLRVLAGMAGLRHLSLRDTKVTDAGVAGLKKALPKLVVEK